VQTCNSCQFNEFINQCRQYPESKPEGIITSGGCAAYKNDYHVAASLLERLAYLHAVIDYFSHLRGMKFGAKSSILYHALLEYPDMLASINQSHELPRLNPVIFKVSTVKSAKKLADRMDAGQGWTQGLKCDMACLLLNIENYFLDIKHAPTNMDRHFRVEEIQEAGSAEFDHEMKFTKR